MVAERGKIVILARLRDIILAEAIPGEKNKNRNKTSGKVSCATTPACCVMKANNVCWFALNDSVASPSRAYSTVLWMWTGT